MTLLGDIDKIDFYSGLNYQKKYLYDTYDTSLSAGNSWTSTQTIPHDLGYAANVRVWIEQDGNGHICTPNPINTTKETVVVTRTYSNSVQIECSSPTASNDVSLKVYYEIYLDSDNTGETGFNFFTKHPIDRVYKIIEGSISVGNSSVETPTIPHSQSKPMIFKAIWSTDNTNWYSVRDFYDPSNVSLNATGEFKVNASNVYPYFFNNLGSTKTFYYKVALIEPEVAFPSAYATSGIDFDTRKKTFINFDSQPTSVTVSGSIGSNAIRTFESTITNSAGLNIADFYFKRSVDSFYYNGYVGAGTALISVPVSGGSFTTDIPIEFFLVTANNSTKVVLWLYNPDTNTVTLTSTVIDLRMIMYISPF